MSWGLVNAGGSMDAEEIDRGEGGLGGDGRDDGELNAASTRLRLTLSERLRL